MIEKGRLTGILVKSIKTDNSSRYKICFVPRDTSFVMGRYPLHINIAKQSMKNLFLLNNHTVKEILKYVSDNYNDMVKLEDSLKQTSSLKHEL